MRRLVLVLATALALPVAAQTATLDVTLSHSPLVGGSTGAENFVSVPATVLGIEASRMVGSVRGSELRLGGVLRAAQTTVFDEERNRPALHHAEALVGASFDIGPSLYDGFAGDRSVSTDGVHALRLGARADSPLDAVTVTARADVFLSAPRRGEIVVTDEEGSPTGGTLLFRSHLGQRVNLQVGATRRVGAVDVGLALVSAQRLAGFSRIEGLTFPSERIPPVSVVSVVPSVAWSGRGGLRVEAALRSPGVVWLEHAELGVPLAVSNARVARWPLSLRVGFAW
jgi:hypothetical protein